MTDEERQNKLWACLTSHQRIMLRGMNKTSGDGNVEFILNELFGHHNLESDTEPAELLFVERKKVISKYETAKNEVNTSTGIKKAYSWGRKSLLDCLFGDKCLPDKVE